MLPSNNLLLNASVLAAQLVQEQPHFRQRDVRFFHSLFSNWFGAAGNPESEDRLHNTQIMRCLNELVQEQLAVASSPDGHPGYRLTKLGITKLIESLRQQVTNHRHFLFVQYFFRCYGSLRPDLSAQMDLAELRRDRLNAIERELEHWETRVTQVETIVQMAREMEGEGRPWKEILNRIESKHPDMTGHNQWEIITGNALRVQHLWLPHMQMLETERKWLAEEVDAL